MLPSDPRTWSDFKNPGQHGFEKVDCDTTLERALVAWGGALAFIAVWLAFEIFVHVPLRSQWSSWHRHFPTSLGMLLLPGLISGSLVLFSLRMLTDNFYLVDSVNHRVYYHFWFLFVRRVSLLLEPKDIMGVSTESRRRRTRYRAWSEQRVVVLGTDTRVVPMTNWRREGVVTCRDTAMDLSKKLGCVWIEVPEDNNPRVAVESGRATTSFGPLSWWELGYGPRLIGAGLGLALFVAFYFLGWNR